MEVAQLEVFIIVRYARALRGEEISKLEITGLLKHYAEGERTEPTHITLSLVVVVVGGNQEEGERFFYRWLRLLGQDSDFNIRWGASWS
jgi:hypothetical protein